MKRKLTLLTDPGHGWLSVARKDLHRLGIADKISQHSFQRGKRVYLEEDRDAGYFLTAAKINGWNLEIKGSHTDKKSWVRYQDRYKS